MKYETNYADFSHPTYHRRVDREEYRRFGIPIELLKQLVFLFYWYRSYANTESILASRLYPS